MIVTLTDLKKMSIADANGSTFVGGSQKWYDRRWTRISGCGPVAACNLIWYMTQPGGNMPRYLDLMREMFNFTTPGLHGVNKSRIFSDGIVRYGEENGLTIVPHVLEVPPEHTERPDINTVRGFIVSALQSDAPVAFLNLSSGTVSALENWHWMTILAIDTDTMHIRFSDHGAILEADISAWRETTTLGGAMIWLTVSKG